MLVTLTLFKAINFDIVLRALVPKETDTFPCVPADVVGSTVMLAVPCPETIRKPDDTFHVIVPAGL